MLQRRGAPAGGLALLCVVLAVPAQAATPAPDPPPEAVSPEPPAPRTQPAPVRSTPSAATPAPAVQRSSPVVRAQPVQTPAAPKAVVKAKPKPKAAAKRTARVVEPVAVAAPRVPHDRARVPLVAFVPAVDELDRGLLAVAGIALLLVALGGAVLAGVASRQLRKGFA